MTADKKLVKLSYQIEEWLDREGTIPSIMWIEIP